VLQSVLQCAQEPKDSDDETLRSIADCVAECVAAGVAVSVVECVADCVAECIAECVAVCVAECCNALKRALYAIKEFLFIYMHVCMHAYNVSDFARLESDL